SYFFAVFSADVAKGIAAIGGAEDSPSARQDSTHVGQFEGTRLFRPDEPVEAILTADHLPVVLQYGGFHRGADDGVQSGAVPAAGGNRSEEHTSELQSQSNLVCRLLLEKKKKKKQT